MFKTLSEVHLFVDSLPTSGFREGCNNVFSGGVNVYTICFLWMRTIRIMFIMLC